jgi:hypothetical protein
MLIGPLPAAGLTPIDVASLSPDVSVTLDGQTTTDEDVASDDLASGVISKPALGVLPEASDLSAYHDLGGGEHLMAFDITVELAGTVTARPGDVVRYDGMNYTIEFDSVGESVPYGVITDSVTVSAGGNLVLSFDTTVELGASTYADEDLVEFDGMGFSSVFDGSAEGLEEALDVDAAHVFGSTGNFGLSFDTGGTIGGIDFDDEDTLEFDPSGPTWEMAWDASVERTEWEPGADVTAIHFVPEPAQQSMLVAGGGLLTLLSVRRQRQRASGLDRAVP